MNITESNAVASVLRCLDGVAMTPGQREDAEFLAARAGKTLMTRIDPPAMPGEAS